MKNTEAKIRELLSDRKRIVSLLIFEKERRGLSKESLVFLGTANVADYSWCAMQSLFKSRREEADFFGAYLQDRLRYSLELGRIEKLPETQADWLDIGNDITLGDIERLLKSPFRQSLASGPRYVEIEKDGITTLVYADDLSPDELKSLPKIKDPKLRGEQLEKAKAERYPSIRWNFAWEKYVVVGIPDGITDRFVYEYKTTRNLGLLRYMKPVAHNQADLYGFFFKRDEKRIQVYIIDKNKTETWQDRVNKKQAETILEKFRRVDAGDLPLPPKEWKCKRCEFVLECPIRASSFGGNPPAALAPDHMSTGGKSISPRLVR